MIAIDTNVIVRLITRDDVLQAAKARQFVAEATQPLFVSMLALVETAWLLRSNFGMDRSDAIRTLRRFLALDEIQIELPEWSNWALDQAESGYELADMLLLAAARDQDKFVTFDKKLARRALPDAPVRIEELA